MSKRTKSWAVCVVLLAACQQPGDEVATIRLPLQTTGTQGTVFRLTNATFDLRGPVMQEVKGDGAVEQVTVDVPPGEYQVSLREGWRLSRVTPTGQVNEPRARLVSENPTVLSIKNREISDVIFAFDVSGQAIAFGQGRARIRIQVDEGTCGNGQVDPGEECDSSINVLPGSGSFLSAPACDRYCTGGPKRCETGADCQSGVCRDRCGECQPAKAACDVDCTQKQATCTVACDDTRNTCKEQCPAKRIGCGDSCRTARAACLALCGYITPACIACQVGYVDCERRCDEGDRQCRPTCDAEVVPCLSGCERGGLACKDLCKKRELQCTDTCRTCATCTSSPACGGGVVVTLPEGPRVTPVLPIP